MVKKKANQVRQVLASSRTMNEKLSYLWQYYWKAGALVCCFLVIGLFFLTQVTQRKTSVLTVGIYTSGRSAVDVRALQKEFTQVVTLSSNKQEVTVTTNDLTRQGALPKLFATLDDHSVDILLLPKDTFTNAADHGAFRPLSLTKKTGGSAHSYRNDKGQIVGVDAKAFPLLRRRGISDGVLAIVKGNRHQMNTEKVLDTLQQTDR